jgi:hypothetical protein
MDNGKQTTENGQLTINDDTEKAKIIVHFAFSVFH